MGASAEQEVTEGCLNGRLVGREEAGLNLQQQKGASLKLQARRRKIHLNIKYCVLFHKGQFWVLVSTTYA